jgi:NAD(P)-dependent dehydrogenase (short-subunit alcohol dehydrogenase family)
MMKAVLITGASTGFGEAVARHFSNAGWNVFATMRNPAAVSPELLASPGVVVARLDVQDQKSIDDAVAQGIYAAATNGTDQLRYSPTNDIQPILNARRSTSEQECRALMLGIFTPQQA